MLLIRIDIKIILHSILGKPKYFGGVYNQILFHLRKAKET